MNKIMTRVGAVLVAGATVVGLGVVGAAPAQAAAFCSGGPALVFPGERDHEVKAGAGFTGASPDAVATYKVDNNGDANVAVAILGYDNAGKATWNGFPLGARGSFTATTHMGEVITTPAIRVTNLDPVRTASISFTC